MAPRTPGAGGAVGGGGSPGGGRAGKGSGNGSGGKEDEGDPKYVSLRVPKSEYDKLKDLRSEMKDRPDYSWVGSLALGAFVGLAAGLALERLARKDGGKGD